MSRSQRQVDQDNQKPQKKRITGIHKKQNLSQKNIEIKQDYSDNVIRDSQLDRKIFETQLDLQNIQQKQKQKNSGSYILSPLKYESQQENIKRKIQNAPEFQQMIQQQQDKQRQQSQDNLKQQYKLEPTKKSNKKNGFVQAFSANTHKGLVRNYNEDRVSIILNMQKPENKKMAGEWPQCSFFGIYDGHGGSKCAEYLRDNLHNDIINNKNFPNNPNLAILQGFNECEKKYLEICQSGQLDRSGSCALIVMVVEDFLYMGNTGDSRALLSMQNGTKVIQLSQDHKPDDPSEMKRISQNGGTTYQTNMQPIAGFPIIQGPMRVFPGRLSVSRTFGDVEAKVIKYGGIPNVIIAEPQVKKWQILQSYDFVILGCMIVNYIVGDGIYEKMDNKQVVDCLWEVMANNHQYEDNHEIALKSIQNLII